jgi:hypothetical protein
VAGSTSQTPGCGRQSSPLRLQQPTKLHHCMVRWATRPLAAATSRHDTGFQPTPLRRWAGGKIRAYQGNPTGTTDATEAAEPRSPAVTQPAGAAYGAVA